ncbi:MAG: creatininase family protein [Oligoflexia bacterium]|nr:creatininase family protein [Oligoflexia bacterium]
MPQEFSRISAQTLEGLPKQQTVFFFPVGGLEDHGPHLPLGLDCLEAERLCTLAAERLERELPGWTGVLMPTAPLSVSSVTTRTAVTVRGHVLRDWLVDACHSLESAGFGHFVCFSGNVDPRQLTAIEEAGKIISRRGPFSMAYEWLGGRSGRAKPTLVSVISGLVSASRVMESPLWPDPVEHGGRRDTSVALALKALPAQGADPATLPARSKTGSRWTRLLDRWQKKVSGYWGPAAPSEATAAWGESVLQTTVNDAFPKLRAVWEGGNPNFLFRSYYSVFPPNKSFFKGWILSLLLIALLLAWFTLSFQTLTQ